MQHCVVMDYRSVQMTVQTNSTSNLPFPQPAMMRFPLQAKHQIDGGELFDLGSSLEALKSPASGEY